MKRLAIALLLLLSLISPASAGGIVSGGTPLSVSLTDSAALAALLGDETGTGAAVFANTPTLVTPILGTPTSGTLTNCTGLPAAGVVGTAAILGANTFTNLQTITQGTANTGILASTGYSLTGSNATSMIDLAGTWNTSGTPTALKINITDTASNAASLLMDLKVGGTTKFNVTKAGQAQAGAYALVGSGGTYAYVQGNAASNGLWFGTAATPTGTIGVRLLNSKDAYTMAADGVAAWTNTGGNFYSANVDAGIARNAAGVVEVNNGTAGTYRDLKVRDIIINSGTMVKSSTAFTDGAAAQTATMTNGPVAGNPTKWIPINDNGTTRYIPAW